MASNITVSISADTAKMTAQLAVAKADLSAFSANLRDMAAQMRAAGSGASDELKAGLSQAAAAAASAQGSVSALQAKIRAARAPMDELSAAGEHQAGIFREKMVMAHEALMGNYSRMAGSMMVLTERTGGFGAALSTLLNPVMLTAAGVIALVGGFAKMAMVSEESEREANKLRTAFAAVGNSGMLTGQQIQGLVEHVASLPGVDREAADQIIESFARTRQIGGQLLGALTQDIDKSARAMGTDAPAAAKMLAAAFADPARGARELDKQYDILTAAQLRQIETLQVQGDRIGAQNILWEAWKARLQSIPNDLTAIQNSTNDLGNAWGRLMHVFGDTSIVTKARNAIAGLMDTMAEKMSPTLGGTEARIADLQKRVEASQQYTGGHANPDDLLELEELKQAKAALEAKKKAQDQLNTSEAKAAAIQQEVAPKNQTAENRKADLTDPALLSTREKIQKIDDEIKRLENDRVGANKEENDLLTARIAMKQRERGTVQVQNWNEQLQSQEETYARMHSTDEDYQQQLLKLRAAFWQKQSSLARAGSQEQIQADQQAAAAISQVNLRELADKKAALAEEHAQDEDFKAQELKLEIEFYTEKTKLAAAGSSAKVQAETAARDATMRLNEQEAQAAAESAKKKQAVDKSNADTDIRLQSIALAAAKDELDAEVEEHKISATQRAEILKTLTAVEQQAELARLDAEIESLKVGDTAFNDAVNRRKIMLAEFAVANAKTDKDIAAADKAAAAETKKAWEEAVQPIARAFDGMVSGVLQGTQSIGQATKRAAANMLLTFIEAIAKMAAQWAAFQAATSMGFGKLAGAIGNPLSGGGLGGVIGGALGMGGGKDAQSTAQTTATTANTAAINTLTAALSGNTTASTAASTATTSSATATAAQTTASTAQTAATTGNTTSLLGQFGSWIAGLFTQTGAETANTTALAANTTALGAGGAAGGGGLLSSLFSFDVGTSSVPNDMVAKIHQGEIIVPPAQSAAIRSGTGVLATGRALGGLLTPQISMPGGLSLDSAAPSVAASGQSSSNPTVTFHSAPISIVVNGNTNQQTVAEIENMLTRHNQGVAKAFNRALRNGAVLHPMI